MDSITPVLQSILDEIVAHVETTDLPGWCRTGLVGGNAAWDVCCECSDGSGQLWVRLINWEVDPAFEQPTPHSCDQPTRLVIGVGSLRCVPTVDEAGDPPTQEEEQDAAELLHWDAAELKNAVMCNTDERYWVQWLALPYSGGCGGGEHVFSIPFSGCSCD